MVTLNPFQGPTSGGNDVIITGTAFTGATMVKFGAKNASFTVDSDTQITAVAPSNSSAVQVVVTTPFGSSTPVWYFYLLPPSKSSLSSTAGPLSGATTTLTGANLTTTTAVEFGSTAAASFDVVNDTTVDIVAPTVTTPATVPVSVTTRGGTSNGITFSFVAAPTVTSMDPTAGPDYGGTASTITGTNFSAVTDVIYGTDSAAFQLIDDSTLISYSPGGTGTVGITVLSPGGSNTSQSFTYNVTPG
ncbi:IPT/TIG domain-containing protein [Streptomyces sp. NBS 14/10]|uniref:IPT/TIG domain-containing protein n=1 Tax=Streptomyces sp. NBS 14/10 TaxID=1945643 RepID=UPI000B7E004E|nr:IPT/TIG domain-containing protein [Streptomyces sp. NBS 14/10]KAK1178905.1 IPT/TIG domain-containing protein [Streptomyces sp. NBS 14/10]NUP41049.1 cell surface protein [Streptomyces sp.]NUS89228.1 cell surface protein [Streptomyces sp.]